MTQTNFAEKTQAIYDWLRMVVDSSVAIIEGQQNAPRPEGTYLEYLTGDIIRQGTGDEMRFEQGDDKFVVHGQRRLPVTVEAIGPDAFSLISDVQNSLGRPTVRQFLRDKGLSVQDEGNVTDVTKFLETEFEQRAQLQVIFGYKTLTDEDPGRIEKVGYTGTTNGHNFTDEIP